MQEDDHEKEVKRKLTASSSTGPRKENNIIIRTYQPTDHDACELLEIKANQFKNQKVRNLPLVGHIFRYLLDSIQVHAFHPQGFDAMAKTADEYEIIVSCHVEDDVARNSENPTTTAAATPSSCTAEIIAVVLVNIRTVMWSGTSIKVGWVYGLRVDEAYQRRGIGLALYNELEHRCRRRGVSMLHLTVNLDNAKAIGFYQHLGYSHASHRAPSVKFLTNTLPIQVPTEQDNLLVVFPITDREVAASLAFHTYKSMDMIPSTKEGFLKLFTSNNNNSEVVTFVAVKRSDLSPKLIQLMMEQEENHTKHNDINNTRKSKDKEISIGIEEEIRNGKVKNYGVVSLLNGSTFKEFKVVRFVFLKETWLSRSFQLSLLTPVIAFMGHWWWNFILRVGTVVYSYWYPQNQQNILDLWWSSPTPVLVHHVMLESILIAILTYVSYKTINFASFILTRDLQRLSARAFAPFSYGPMGIECLRSAITASKNYARGEGYGIWIMNVAADHPLSSAFPKPGFRTEFLQKWLCDPPPPSPSSTTFGVDARANDAEERRSEEECLKEFSLTAFCDPRDL